MLTPEQRKQADMKVTEGFKVQLDFLQKMKAQNEYEKSQEDIRLKMQNNSNEI